jgi:hypothetical protein
MCILRRKKRRLRRGCRRYGWRWRRRGQWRRRRLPLARWRRSGAAHLHLLGCRHRRRRRNRALGEDVPPLRSGRLRDGSDGVRPWRREKAAREPHAGIWCGAGGGVGHARARVCGGADGRGVAHVGRGRRDARVAFHRRNFAGGTARYAKRGRRREQWGIFRVVVALSRAISFRPRALERPPQIQRKEYRSGQRAGPFLPRAEF